MHIFKHFLTITKHRHKVIAHCAKAGIFWQGLRHDLSKYSPAEFLPGAKYYQGNRSPQTKERELFGYSPAWLHHKGRNKHHFEYWTDFCDGRKVYVQMPANYFAEMICDRVAASKIYLKDKYTNSSPLEYFENKTDQTGMNENTAQMLRFFLAILAERGEEDMFAELKKYVKQSKRKNS